MGLSAISKPYRPLLLKISNAVVQAIDHKDKRFMALSEDKIIKKVCKKCGLHDFGDDSYLEPLKIICEHTRSGKPLTFLGRLIAYDYLTHRLQNKLKIQAEIKAHPEIRNQKIDRPIFITGLPRTGTTLLQRLLAQDPTKRSLQSWEMSDPVPPPDPNSYERDPRIKWDKLRWALLEYATPNFKAIHEVGATRPEECISLMANDLISGWFVIGMDSPKYARWLFEHGISLVYPLHKRQLQLLQWKFPEAHWVLKSPWHLYGLEWLLKVYPDARILQTHRDPSEVLPSMASLITTLRSALHEGIEAYSVGAETLDMSAEWVERGLVARNKEVQRKDSKAIFHDIYYRDLVADPMEIVRKIYDVCGLQLSAEAEKRMLQFLKENPKNKHGKHRYSLQQFGMDKEELRRRFQSYCDTFNIC